MSELRLNLITREWIIVNKEKCKKLEDFIVTKEKKRRPEFLETCPFCHGNLFYFPRVTTVLFISHSL
jgi:UDPglucose--hexose-1-phosphate uridylyltransferase